MEHRDRMCEYFIGAMYDYIMLCSSYCEDCPDAKDCGGELDFCDPRCYRWSDYSRAEEATCEYVDIIRRLLS